MYKYHIRVLFIYIYICVYVCACNGRKSMTRNGLIEKLVTDQFYPLNWIRSHQNLRS